MSTTETIKNFEALRKSGKLGRLSQQRADEISRHLVLANEQGGDRYEATVRRAGRFVQTWNEIQQEVES